MKRGLMFGALCLSLVLILSLSVVSADAVGDFFKNVFDVGDKGVMYSPLESGLIYSEDFEDEIVGQIPANWPSWIQDNKGTIEVVTEVSNNFLLVKSDNGRTVSQSPKITINPSTKYKLSNSLVVSKTSGDFYVKLYCYNPDGTQKIGDTILKKYTSSTSGLIKESYEFISNGDSVCGDGVGKIRIVYLWAHSVAGSEIGKASIDDIKLIELSPSEGNCGSNDDCPSIKSPRFCNEDSSASCVMVNDFICQNPGSLNSQCVPAGGGASCQECPNSCKDGECLSGDIMCNRNDDCPSVEEKYCSDSFTACVSTTKFQCQNPGTVNSQCVKMGGGGGCGPCPYGCKDGECVGGEPEEECKQNLEVGEHVQFSKGFYIMVWEINYALKPGTIDTIDFTLSEDLKKDEALRDDSTTIYLGGKTYTIRPTYISDTKTKICVSIDEGPEEICGRELEEKETAILSDGSSISIWSIDYASKSGTIDSVDFVLMSDMQKGKVERDSKTELYMDDKKYVVRPSYISDTYTTLCVSSTGISICGNGICEVDEDVYNCPVDCLPKPCKPRYYCETKPTICPKEGIQIKTCKDVECGEPDYSEQITCNPGECSGCEFEKRCIPYGFRTQVALYNKIPGKYNLYCEIDGSLQLQKTKLSDGSWASCQNNYECESNVCSGGDCIEINDMITQAKGFKSLGVRVLCRLAHMFSEDNYGRCIYNFLGETPAGDGGGGGGGGVRV